MPPHLRDVAALSCITVIFQKSHKFKNTVLVFINKILLKLIKKLKKLLRFHKVV